MSLLFPAVAGLLGLLVGSFLNVVIHRLPIMMDRESRRYCRDLAARDAGQEPAAVPGEPAYNLLQPRSACPACGTPIRPWHNIPVLGYLWLRGRCAACGAGISLRYPVVEALTGLLSVLVAVRFGPGLEGLAALGLTWTLVALSGIDLDTQLLPDVMTLPLVWAGILLHLLAGSGLQDAVIGAVAGYLSLWLVYHGFRLVTGKEGMGYGDFKLFAALGAWLGWQMLPLVILLSALTGATAGLALMAFRGAGRSTAIPFGPYLAAAGFIALIWGRDLMSAYWRAALPGG